MSDVDRENLIVERRANRVPFRLIGGELGISAQRAHQIFKDACDKVPAEAVRQVRMEESELADRAIGDLLGIAENEHVSPRTRVEAWSAVRGWSESKRKLHGADAPTRRELTVVSGETVDLAIADLTREMEQQVAAAQAAGIQIPEFA